jgi:hypothetical protein
MFCIATVTFVFTLSLVHHKAPVIVEREFQKFKIKNYRIWRRLRSCHDLGTFAKNE